MTYKQAVLLAIRCIEAQMKKIVFEANLAREGSDSPYHKRCLFVYTRMEKAIEILADQAENRIK